MADLVRRYNSDKQFKVLVNELRKLLDGMGKDPRYLMEALALAIALYRKERGLGGKVDEPMIIHPGGIV